MTEGHLLPGNKQNPQQEIRSKTDTHTHKLRDFFANKHINSTTAITSKQWDQLIVQGTKDWHLVSPCKKNTHNLLKVWSTHNTEI